LRLRVASWNLHSCIGTDGRLDVRRVGDVLSRLDADFIGFQEVDRRVERTDGRDQLEYLADRLNMHPIAGPNLRDPRGDFGNGLLARSAAHAHELLDLSVPAREPRGAIDACFRFEGADLRVLVTHLGLTRSERARQISILRNHLAGAPKSDAVVLLGDLNEWRPAPLTRSNLTPVPFAVSSRLRTFPSRRPVFGLDRVLASPRPDRFEARTQRSRLARIASDHLPVVADIEWA
jgi:endonuclease/exonuclease/phosphatase family metal-dependent hydrolase